jgi:hypothetical protein
METAMNLYFTQGARACRPAVGVVVFALKTAGVDNTSQVAPLFLLITGS